MASGHCLKYARKLSLFSENFGTIASDHTRFYLLSSTVIFADLSFLLLCHFCYDFQQRDHSTLSGLNILPVSLPTTPSLLLSELCPSCIMLQGVNIYLIDLEKQMVCDCVFGHDHTLLLSFTSVVERSYRKLWTEK